MGPVDLQPGLVVSFGPRVSLDHAAVLLDFKGRPDAAGVSIRLADEQLAGAVAAHNLVQGRGLAYIADEVGTGKTLVAAGVLALLRHREPGMRALVIAPRANLQDKWQKELISFAQYNVRYPDLRVRGLGPEPVRPPRVVPNLGGMIAAWEDEPDCDVIARLSSFSLGHRQQTLAEQRAYVNTWRSRLGARGSRTVNRLLNEAVPGKDGRAVKQTIAACVNRLLPSIGLLVVDESHNLKGGIERGAPRNRVLWTLLGHNPAFVGVLPGYGPRVDRVLLLSATPMEDDTEQLQEQLKVLGVDDRVPELESEDEATRRRALNLFLFRRLTRIQVGEESLTRNRYRQEWLLGGTVDADTPLALDDARGRLTFAVVQKKVADALNGGGDGRNFQIGMLTSFESLASSAVLSPKTPSVKKGAKSAAEVISAFDGAEQIRLATEAERLGIDDVGIRALVASHEKVFGRPPAHPKMDAVVDRLVDGARRGRKALVFTRRIASVDELIQRVNDRLDFDLGERLGAELPGLESQVTRLLGQYRDYRTDPQVAALGATLASPDLADDEELPADDTAETDDELTPAATDTLHGGSSLFRWLFVKRPSRGLLTGWWLRQRLEQRSGAYTTVLQDNYVAAVLSCEPSEVLERLGQEVGDCGDVAAQVNALAQGYLGTMAEPPTLVRFRAAQLGGLRLLDERGKDEIQRRAAIALGVVARGVASSGRQRAKVVPVAERLAEDTLASRLRSDPDLCGDLWHSALASDWSSEDEFQRREWRWRMLAAATRLDYPALDLWLCEVRRHGRLDVAQHQPDGSRLAVDFLSVLRRQRDDPPERWTSFAALHALAANADLILQVNGIQTSSDASPAWLGNRLPAVGMWGQINATAVRQFRTPTYPLVLVSTDLLQEGEDLHTFCDEVHHYGIAWMPSSLEQRTGRVDRVNSLTERRLSGGGCKLGADGRPAPSDRLNVLFPFISGTYEQVQVKVVLKRLHDHIRLLHESFGQKVPLRPTINVDEAIVEDIVVSESVANLGQPYPVNPKWLGGAGRFPIVDASTASRVHAAFGRLTGLSRIGGFPVTWLTARGGLHLLGECRLGARVQPLDLRLTSVRGRPAVRITSPVGLVSREQLGAVLSEPVEGPRIGLVRLGPKERRSFSVTVEDLVLVRDHGEMGPVLRPHVASVLNQADELERTILDLDLPLLKFAEDLRDEVDHG